MSMASVWTLTEVTEFYTEFKAAYLALISGKSYTINTGGTSRSLTRQDLSTVKKEMMFWKNEAEKINNDNSGIIKRFGTPAQ